MAVLPKIRLSIIFSLLSFSCAIASEGMWMPDEKGNLSPKIQNATIMFGDMCTGVFVSPNGLLLTNHHCALEAIHSLSTLKKNHLDNGFIARSERAEIPVSDLNIKRLLYIRELTDRIAAATAGVEREVSRRSIIDNLIRTVCDSVVNDSPFIFATVEAYYEQTRYFLNVYEVFHDIRLVMAPPYVLGAFGGEADNWMWPRCSADFAVLRVYASSGNVPSFFSPKNKPLQVQDYAAVSTQGYQPLDSVMTVGFPGATARYSTSWEVEAIRNGENAPRIEVREMKLAHWRDAMACNSKTKLSYSSKFSECANFYKYATGMNLWMDSLSVIGQKKEAESRLLDWVAQDSLSRMFYKEALLSIRDEIAEKLTEREALTYFIEALLGGAEIVGLPLALAEFDLEDDKETRAFVKKQLARFYENYDAELDKSLLKKMLTLAKKRIPEEYLPTLYDSIRVHYKGDVDTYVDNLFDQSLFGSEKRIKKALSHSGFLKKTENDPISGLAFSIQTAYYNLHSQISGSEYRRIESRRILFNGWRDFLEREDFYSDANFTMRKSFGAVKGFPDDKYYTTSQDLLAKNATMQAAYFLPPSMKELFDGKGENGLRLCFISDNDITGGNSGSPVFNSEGNLIGLAFDGNWQGMSGDLLFGATQRAIHVDIRYVLFLIRQWAKAEALYNEIMGE